MERQTLAISSVPVQSWGALFCDEEAMRKGTIFRELYKPFFAAEEQTETLQCPGREQTEREKLLARIGETAFVLDDLTLYLDTHAQDPEALSLYRERLQEKEELSRRFAEQFYPLSRCCILNGQRGAEDFCWAGGSLPWEGECGHVEL